MRLPLYPRARKQLGECHTTAMKVCQPRFCALDKNTILNQPVTTIPLYIRYGVLWDGFFGVKLTRKWK